MKIVQKAKLAHPDGKVLTLSLFQVEPTVFRWIDDQSCLTFDGIDYLDRETAVIKLRADFEHAGHPIGTDLTILPVEPPPEERAAKRIKAGFIPIKGATDLDVDLIAKVILEETAVDALRAHGETLLAFLIMRIGNKDLTLTGLMLPFLDALEKSGGVTFDAIRKVLTEPPKQLIVPGRSIPPGGKVN